MCDELLPIINTIRKVREMERALGRPMERGEIEAIFMSVRGYGLCTADSMDLWWGPFDKKD